MQLFLVQGVGSVLMLAVFVALASGGNPFALTLSAMRGGFVSRGARRACFAIFAVIALNYAEGIWDPHLTHWLNWDATPWVHALEGDLVGHLQALTPRALIAPLAVIYVPGYLAMLVAPLVIWVSSGDQRIALRYVIAFVLNYFVALPFFLFVPVREVGWSGLSTAKPLLDTIWPGITEALRTGSPLDNCFPSMHVSCVVTALWYAHHFGPRRLTLLAWLVAPTIAWSTMALGIHWAADVVAGLIVAVGCCLIADRILLHYEVKRRGNDAMAGSEA